jgi:hypothetical protein
MNLRGVYSNSSVVIETAPKLPKIMSTSSTIKIYREQIDDKKWTY